VSWFPPLGVVGSDPYRALAVLFLATKHGSSNVDKIYDEDPRAAIIGRALEGVGFGPPDEALGEGSFGLAATLVEHPDLVIKITADLSEVQIATFLTGKDLEHVAKVRGAWMVPDVKVTMNVGWDHKEEEPIYAELPVGIVVVTKVRRDDQVEEDIRKSHLNAVVRRTKDDQEVYPDQLTSLPKKRAREKLRRAADLMVERLYGEGNEVCDDVAQAIDELQAEGVYAVDVHAGNVGYNDVRGCYQVFDVGVGSPPPGRVRVKKAPTPRASRAAAEPIGAEYTMENPLQPPAAPLAAIRIETVEATKVSAATLTAVQTAPPQPLVAVPGAAPTAQHTHPVVPAAEDAEERGLQWKQRRDGVWRADGVGGTYYVAPQPSGSFHAWWFDRGGQQIDLGGSSTLGGAFGRANSFQPAIAAEVPAAAEVVPVIHEAPAVTEVPAVAAEDMVPAKDIPWIKVERDPKKYAHALKVADQIGKIDGPRKIYELTGDKLSREDQEVFLVILCNVHGKLRGVVEVARGQRSRVGVGIVDIFRPVIESGAESFAVVHNHPSGSANPSQADKELTKSIERAAKELVGRETAFLDHVIVGMGEFYSFDERRLFKVATPQVAKKRRKA
jgi:hypothetical protein